MKKIINVPKLIYGKNTFDELEFIIDERKNNSSGKIFYLVDDVFVESKLVERIPVTSDDEIIFVNVDKEPETKYVDTIVEKLKTSINVTENIGALVGIGGGSTLDICKAVSIVLTNGGSSADYQGWDLVKKKPVYKIGIPTLSGTGSEVSRTCVLSSPTKKQGINTIFSLFDELILDPLLLNGVNREQRFYTAMDCFIHSVESLRGHFKNGFAKAFAEKAMDLCIEVFLNEPEDADEKLMMASYLGGCSIVYSEVGICHALSYGLSHVFGYHHGIANCIIFDKLEEYYINDVIMFRKMVEKNKIKIPQNVLQNVTDEELYKMIKVAYLMEKPLNNALGANWKDLLTPEVIKKLYRKM